MFQKDNKRRFDSESGQAMVEYGFIIAIIVITVFIVMASGMGVKVFDMYQYIQARISALF